MTLDNESNADEKAPFELTNKELAAVLSEAVGADIWFDANVPLKIERIQAAMDEAARRLNKAST